MIATDELIEKAKKAREKAYAPYSDFKVGSALLSEDGKIYTGCNVENVSFGLSICAERVAIFKAVSEGKISFSKLVVVADTENPPSPCGACCQVIQEFGGKDVEIIMANLQDEAKTKSIVDLLPLAFDYREDLTFK